jgi:ketosteroid isomerase-like protein
MKRACAVLFTAFLTLGLGLVRGEEKAEASADVKALDAKLTDAVKHGDTTTLEKHLAEDFLVVDPLGRVHDKKSYLAHVSKDNARFEDLKETQVQARVFGDTAVVTGLLELRGSVKGKDVSGQYRWTRVYNKKGDHWRCVVEQHTYVVPKEKE